MSLTASLKQSSTWHLQCWDVRNCSILEGGHCNKLNVLAGIYQEVCTFSLFESEERLCSPHGNQSACIYKHHARDILHGRQKEQAATALHRPNVDCNVCLRVYTCNRRGTLVCRTQSTWLICGSKAQPCSWLWMAVLARTLVTRRVCGRGSKVTGEVEWVCSHCWMAPLS